MERSLDPRRKKLLYRSQHRGMKEADLLLGGFVDRHLETMSEDDVSAIESLLDESDNDLVNWILGRETVPEEIASDVLLRMIAENDDA
ncbi:MAG: succinate dehydrogenase assembly factor 2 [Rhodospirillales bacterium]